MQQQPEIWRQPLEGRPLCIDSLEQLRSRCAGTLACLSASDLELSTAAILSRVALLAIEHLEASAGSLEQHLLAEEALRSPLLALIEKTATGDVEATIEAQGELLRVWRDFGRR